MSPDTHRISRITGRRQAVALRLITLAAAAASFASLLLPAGPAAAAGTAAVALVTVTPLLRVGWLIWRWWQERDLAFVWLGAALLGIVAAGGLVTLLGVGR